MRLDFQGFVFSQGNDLPFLTYLPSYAASAWYHKKLPPDLQQADLPAVLKEVEQWTDREYASILARGDRLTDDERREAAARLARYTGLKPADIDANHLRIGMSHFCKELLKPERRSIGRFDCALPGDRELGRVRLGPASTPAWPASAPRTRPPSTTTSAPSWATRPTSPITSSAKGSAAGTGRREMGYPATTDDLRDAMTKNPHMKVLIASGYYDLATPYRAVEHTLAGLGTRPESCARTSRSKNTKPAT